MRYDQWKQARPALITGLVLLSILSGGCGGGKQAIQFPQDLVWPRPPDVPRVKFIATVSSEEDVGGVRGRKISELLLGKDPGEETRRLRQPYGISTDAEGKIYVTDSAQGVIFVFDQVNARVTFIGRSGRERLAWPIDVVVASDGTVFVPIPD